MDWWDSEYLDETAFEQYLLGEGITEEQLEKDLGNRLNLEDRPVKRTHCEFIEGGKKVKVRAYGLDESSCPGSKMITDWLTEMDLETLKGYWQNNADKNKIKCLMRYPGGLHEWLILASIPMLKEMQIPMTYILNYRTPTKECYFFIGNKKCCHGRNRSAGMHRALYRAIKAAYEEWSKNKKSNACVILGEHLQQFAKEYYGNGAYKMPEDLNNLIVECRNKEKPLYE